MKNPDWVQRAYAELGVKKPSRYRIYKWKWRLYRSLRRPLRELGFADDNPKTITFRAEERRLIAIPIFDHFERHLYLALRSTSASRPAQALLEPHALYTLRSFLRRYSRPTPANIRELANVLRLQRMGDPFFQWRMSEWREYGNKMPFTDDMKMHLEHHDTVWRFTNRTRFFKPKVTTVEFS